MSSSRLRFFVVRPKAAVDSPVVSGGKLFIRDQDHLYAYNIAAK